jgi:copper chaperone
MKTKITLSNVKCGGCADNIKKGLHTFPEISEIGIDVPSGVLELTYDDNFPLSKIKEKLSSIGYPEKA